MRWYRSSVARGAFVLIGMLVGGCASDAPSGDIPVRSTTAGATTAGAQNGETSTSIVPTRSSTAPAALVPSNSDSSDANDTSELVLVDVTDGLDRPVDLAVRPGDDALYIVEQVGTVVQIGADDPAKVREVLDVSDLTEANGEQGLLGLAFSPDGTWGYINYTDRSGDTVVAALPVADDGTFDSSRLRNVLQIDQPYANHNGGDLQFGPDGMLYIATGDGGSGGDPKRFASDTSSLLGKLLRIDPTPAAAQSYTIPADNPFAPGTNTQRDGAPEVWSWGLRNPWRFTFDLADGSLWIADVGQSSTEEIDHVTMQGQTPAGRGANFGWSAMEGDQRFNKDVSPDGAIAPVWVYPHGPGCSISGGAVYRGTTLVGITGDYFYGDYCSGELSAYRESDDRNRTVLTGLGSITAVCTGPDGEIYVLTIDGKVRRLDDSKA